MKESTLTLLNTGVLTAYGTYIYEPLTLEEARALVRKYQTGGRKVQSAIGHKDTADLLTDVLGFPVAENRGMKFEQTMDDVALVLRLNDRPSAGKILSRAEVEEIGYEFGLLTRIA